MRRYKFYFTQYYARYVTIKSREKHAKVNAPENARLYIITSRTWILNCKVRRAMGSLQMRLLFVTLASQTINDPDGGN